MIPQPLIDKVNNVKKVFSDGMATLEASRSFQTLLGSSASLQANWNTLRKMLESRRFRQQCSCRVTCAIVGSSGHGKTTIMDELFPDLAERGWLVTQVNDTTSQSLRVEYAPPDSPDLESVVIRSWGIHEIKQLFSGKEVTEQHDRDKISVIYDDESVLVDGSQTTMPEAETGEFRFGRKHLLRPFPRQYEVLPKQLADPCFIASVTTKQLSDRMNTDVVLSVDGQDYNALQLRVVVKDVCLHDPFRQLKKWAGPAAETIAELVIVDTPGLGTAGSSKDEILRHGLEHKSSQIVLDLWRNDELDVIVHLVLCGRSSDFARLWKSVEASCGPREMDNLADRLILAVNGTNIYFTNPQLMRLETPEGAAKEGDRFAMTLVDNVLQKMSPRGRVRPAAICFLDSKHYVEKHFGQAYSDFYEQHRPELMKWVRSDDLGYDTLSRLCSMEMMRDNIEALCDPEDCGIGFLVRQIAKLVETTGPALVLQKHILRNGLLESLEVFGSLIGRYYETDGTLNRQAVQDALRSCLSFLDANDPQSIETFTAGMDRELENVVPSAGPGRASPTWILDGFHAMSERLVEAIVDRARPDTEAERVFRSYFKERSTDWAEQWGYRSADLPHPRQSVSPTGDLIGHALKLHAREMVYQLLLETSEARGLDNGNDLPTLSQSEEDRESIRRTMESLKEAISTARSLCQQYDVRT